MTPTASALPYAKSTLRSALFPLAVILLASTMLSFAPDLDILIVLAGLLILAVWILVQLILAAMAVGKRNWEKSAQILAAFAFSALLALPVFRYAGNCIHLAAMYVFYRPQIVAAHGRPVAFDWGGSGFAGIGDMNYTLVHDPSGQAGLQSGDRMLADRTHIHVETRHLFGPFYVQTTSYP